MLSMLVSKVYLIITCNVWDDLVTSDEFSDPGVTSLGLLSDLQSGELTADISGDSLDHTLSIDEL